MRIFQFILLIILGACEQVPQFDLMALQGMLRDEEFRTPIVTVLTIPF